MAIAAASDASLGWSLVAVGALVASVGAVLIYVRSRVEETHEAE